jgi:hypothetical protein
MFELESFLAIRFVWTFPGYSGGGDGFAFKADAAAAADKFGAEEFLKAVVAAEVAAKGGSGWLDWASWICLGCKLSFLSVWNNTEANSQDQGGIQRTKWAPEDGTGRRLDLLNISAGELLGARLMI